MTIAVGFILLGVFLVFALLMFLDRLSALLALPLMALCFVVIGAASDLLQLRQTTEIATEETVDAFGRRSVTHVQKDVPARFEVWKEVRLAQARILHDKAALLKKSVEELTAAIAEGPERMRAVLRDVYAREQAFKAESYAVLDAMPSYCASPPDYGGQRASFDDAFKAIAVSESFWAIATVLDEDMPASERTGQIGSILAAAREEAREALERHPAAPESGSLRFRVMAGGSYLLHHVILTLRAGSLMLYATIIATIFGGMFAVYVKNLKVAERMVYWTAEFAGERPFVICLAVFVITGVIFTSVGGLGTVIMLGTIILPILRSVGVGPVQGAGIFLIGISMGGTLHPVSRRLWMDFYGIAPGQLDVILWTMVALYAVCGIVWTHWATRGRRLSNFHAVEAEEGPRAREEVPARLMVAPLIPVVLVYFARIEEITAFTASLVYMFVCVCRRRGALRVFARSLIEGAQMVMPPVLLMVGIGILLTALFTEPVQGYLRPLLSRAVPDSRWGYIVTFAVAAPLALYRGPLNVWGMGLAVSATLLATSSLPPAAILCAILAAGMLQSVCDPTNTSNVWIAGFQGVTANQILRATIVLVWGAAIVAIVIFGLWYVPG